MKTRKLGIDGPEVSAISLGCMSFAGFFGTTDKAESFECLDAARDQGITFLDTAELYGKGYSEELIGEYQQDGDTASLLQPKAESLLEESEAKMIIRKRHYAKHSKIR